LGGKQGGRCGWVWRVRPNNFVFALNVSCWAVAPDSAIVPVVIAVFSLRLFVQLMGAFCWCVLACSVVRQGYAWWLQVYVGLTVWCFLFWVLWAFRCSVYMHHFFVFFPVSARLFASCSYSTRIIFADSKKRGKGPIVDGLNIEITTSKWNKNKVEHWMYRWQIFELMSRLFI